MRGAAVNVKSCVAEAANVSGLAPAAFVLDAASIQNAAAEKAAAEKETDEKDEEKQEKERLRKEKEKAEKKNEEKEEKELLREGKAAAEITAEKEKAEREKEKNEAKERLRKAAAEKAKKIEYSCISNGAELERPSRSTRSTDGQLNFMDVLVETMEGCGSSDTHYAQEHSKGSLKKQRNTRAQQRQPKKAEKENSLLPSVEPQDSLPKKLIESSSFRHAGYSGSILLKANLEVPATKANLESPATHQSQTNSTAKESFEQASVVAPLAHATSTTDVNLEIQATHRSQTNSIEEIAGNSTLMKTISPHPKTIPHKSNLEIQAGAANALMGTNFGVSESKIAPVAKIDLPTSGKRLPSTVKADLLCGNEPFEHVKKNKDTEGKSRYELQLADDALRHALHHTHRESARLFSMAVRQGTTDSQISAALQQCLPHLTDPDNRVLGISRTVAAERNGREGDADNCGKRETCTLENVLAAGNSAPRYAKPSKGGCTSTKVQY
jgi:hypothetical protein